MDFLTIEYVKQEAAKGTLPALKCSLKHHEQGRDADKMDLIVAITEERFTFGLSSCACCQAFKCTKCPLSENKQCCGGTVYYTARDAFGAFKGDCSIDNFTKYRKAATTLCTYIEGKTVECEEKEKKPEVTYSIGDRFKKKIGGEEYILANIAPRKLDMICVGDGSRDGISPFTPRMQGAVSCGEIKPFLARFTRTFDYQKQVYTDGRDDKKECKCKSKALDKPELKSGDLVVWSGNNGGLYVALNDGSKLRWYSLLFNRFISDVMQNEAAYTIIGNLKDIFDDLAAIGEGVEEFTRDDLKAQKSYNRFGFKINKTCIDYEGDNYVSLNLEEIEETILNLRRMVVKLKTK